MTNFDPAASAVWKDLSGSLPYDPKKAEIRGWAAKVEGGIVTLESAVGALQALGIEGYTLKEVVVAATTGNVALTGAYAADGVTLVNGDRYLAWLQTDPAENGVYIYNSAGVHARATDMDTAGEVLGSGFAVSSGTAHTGKVIVTHSVVTTLETDDIVFYVAANLTGILTAIANHDTNETDPHGATSAGMAILKAANPAAQRTALELGALEQLNDDGSDKAALFASDVYGFNFFYADEDWLVAAGLEAKRGGDRTMITDLKGFQYDDRPQPAALSAPLLPARLFGVTGVEFGLHRDGLMQDRDVPARMVLNGAAGLQIEGQEMLRCDLSGLGVTATVSLRSTTCAARYGEQSVAVNVAPQSPGASNTPAVLLVGDSITYRGSAAMIDYWLGEWGYTPSWIGTLTGEGETDPTDGTTALTGKLGEGKPGHALADLTYLFTGRVAPLAPGAEATYNGETVENKRLYNTMIRLAAGEAAGDQRNGYVLDFANYISRHSLATPDMMVIGYGTNDIRDAGLDVIRDHIYDEYSLVFRRWFASYPNKHVVVWMAGTAAEYGRSRVWANSYVPALKGMIKAATDETTANAGAGEVLVVPAWAMAAHSAGYDLSASTETVDADTGATLRQIEDTIHPTGGTRFATLKSVAAAVACAIQGNI